MTHILNIAEAVLYVQDIGRARDFYTRVLGLPVTLAFADSCFLQTGPNSTLILFDLAALRERDSVIPAHGAEGEGHVAFAIPAEEMAAWRERLQAQGVEIEHEMDWPAGTHSIYFRDPDHNSIELIDRAHYPKLWERVKVSGEGELRDDES